MRPILAIHTLFRSMLKTLLTFILLTAASFMLIYNVSDYTLAMREFQSTVQNYQGICFVEHGPAQTPAICWRPYFLLSDPSNLANYDNFYPYETYHQQSLSSEEVNTIASLPYITMSTPRYMTAGVSPTFYRTDKQGISASIGDAFFSTSARVVLEVTLEKLDYSPRWICLLYTSRCV